MYTGDGPYGKKIKENKIHKKFGIGELVNLTSENENQYCKDNVKIMANSFEVRGSLVYIQFKL